MKKLKRLLNIYDKTNTLSYMKYTIEQINEAWIRYNQPMFLIKKGKKLDSGDIEMISRGILPEGGQTIEPVHKVDFISYLIKYFSKAIGVSKIAKKESRI